MKPPALSILLADPHSRGGGQVTYIARLSAQLLRMGHRVAVACRPGSALADIARANRCDCFDEFAFRGGLRPASWLADIRAMRRLFREWRPDIVHVNSSQDHWTAAAANLFLKRRVCLVRTRHNTYRVARHGFNRLLNLRWTDYHIVVCAVVRDELESISGFPPEKMCVIHNGVDAAAFSPDPVARASARAEFGFDGGDVVAGMAARFVADKGHRFLFEAAASLCREYPRLRLLLLGQGVLEEPLREMARELGLSSIAVFAGFREDIARCTQAFDIAVLPSVGCDTSSFSLKEEMAAGIPAIASDYGGLPEIVTDGAEGFVTRAGDRRALESALRRMLDDPEGRARMGQAGRARAARDFSVEAFAEKTVEAYRRALELTAQ